MIDNIYDTLAKEVDKVSEEKKEEKVTKKKKLKSKNLRLWLKNRPNPHQ